MTTGRGTIHNTAAATETHPPPGPTSTPPPRHLIGLAGLERDRLAGLLHAAHAVDPEPAAPIDTAPMRPGAPIALLFFEDSTRTRVSFALAARRIGAQPVELTTSGSSISKGETLTDTARAIEAMGVRAIVVRAGQSGAAAQIASRVRLPVVNAGDGRHEHPTQALIDALCFARAHDRTDTFDLSGLSLAIVGDLARSRVFRSDVAAFTALGAEVIGVGPPGMAPASLATLGVRIERDLDALLPEVDGVQMLRVQRERGGAGALASVREYRDGYALTARRAERMKPHAVVMHPGPINRGVEIDHEPAEGGPGLPHSLILDQVAAGVPVRAAVLLDLLAPRTPAPEAATP